MRVISGIRRGLKIRCIEGELTRPTTDRVKESIFNIISRYLPCDEVLDLFAGSGALGIEALSRYCRHCTFVEQNRKALDCVKQNLDAAKFSDSATLVISDALTFLRSTTLRFDIIFLDPPYNKGFLKPTLDIIADKSLLSKDGIIVIETEKGGESAEHQDFFTACFKTYGKTSVTILKRGDNQ